MARYIFKQYEKSHLDIADPLPMFVMNDGNFDDYVGMTIFNQDTNDIVCILATTKYNLDTHCTCQSKLDVAMLSAIICHPIKDNLLSAIRYGRWVLNELANIYSLDAILSMRDELNPLGDKFLKLVGFEPINYPCVRAGDRSFQPYLKIINKKVVICDEICYLPNINKVN